MTYQSWDEALGSTSSLIITYINSMIKHPTLWNIKLIRATVIVLLSVTASSTNLKRNYGGDQVGLV